jgi:hypothetical protein
MIMIMFEGEGSMKMRQLFLVMVLLMTFGWAAGMPALAQNPYGEEPVNVSDTAAGDAVPVAGPGQGQNQPASGAATGALKTPTAHGASTAPAGTPKPAKLLKTTAPTLFQQQASSPKLISVCVQKLPKAITYSSGVLKIRIPSWIQKLLGFFGVKIASNSVVVINIGGCVKPPATTNPTPVPTAQPNPPVTTNPPSDSQPNVTGDAATLAKKIRDEFGVSALNGKSKWSVKQLEATYKTLASLPPAFRKFTKNIQRDSSINPFSRVLGYVQMGIPTVHMMDASCYKGTFEGTLVHEMVHCFQSSNPRVAQLWEQTFWPNGRNRPARPPSPTSYGNTQPLEDMAESVRLYWSSGAAMKAQQPARYEFIKRYVMDGKTF